MRIYMGSSDHIAKKKGKVIGLTNRVNQLLINLVYHSVNTIKRH